MPQWPAPAASSNLQHGARARPHACLVPKVYSACAGRVPPLPLSPSLPPVSLPRSLSRALPPHHHCSETAPLRTVHAAILAGRARSAANASKSTITLKAGIHFVGEKGKLYRRAPTVLPRLYPSLALRCGMVPALLFMPSTPHGSPACRPDLPRAGPTWRACGSCRVCCRSVLPRKHRHPRVWHRGFGHHNHVRRRRKRVAVWR